MIAGCAASAGAHAALVPSHLRAEPALGVAFVAATVALLVAVVALTVQPASARAASATAWLLAALIGAYALSVTTGIPWLAEEPEAVDRVALATKAVEALALAFALLPHPATGGHRPLTRKEARP